MFYILLSILFFLVLIEIWSDRRKRKYYQKLGFHYPIGLPVIGTSYRYFNVKTWYRKAIRDTQKYSESPHMVTLANFELTTVFQPDILQKCLTSNRILAKSNEHDLVKDWLGTGLLTGTGDKWRYFRKLLTPSFHYKILEDYVKIFNVTGNVLLDKLQQKCDQKVFDIFEYANRYTLDVICKTAMGVNIDAQNNNNSDFVEAIKGMCELFWLRVIVVPFRIDWIYRLTHYYRREKKYLKILNDFSESIIENRKAAVLNSTVDTKESSELGIRNKSNIIDVLLAANVNDADIIEEVNTFIFAGHETTTLSLCFALYELSKNPEIQQKAYNEIITTIGPDPAIETSLNDLNQLKYLEMVIKETLRKYSPVPLVTRQIDEDFEYMTGKFIPKGCTLGLSIAAVHFNETLYPNPDVFDPERFSTENVVNRHPYAYIPFSAGPRNCIGQRFALLELKCIISKILQKFVLLESSPEFKVKVTAQMTLKSLNGFPIKIKNRC